VIIFFLFEQHTKSNTNIGIFNDFDYFSCDNYLIGKKIFI